MTLLTPEQIVDRYLKGESLIKLAPLSGMSYYKLRDTLERMGVPLRFGGPKGQSNQNKVDDNAALIAVKAIIKGESLTKAAESIGVTRLTLTRALERNGWKEKGGPVRLPYQIYKATESMVSV